MKTNQYPASNALSAIGRLICGVSRIGNRGSRLAAARRGRNRRGVRLESLEDRTLFAVDGLAVVRDGAWLFNTDNDAAAEVDLQYGLPGDTFVSGNWTGNWILENPGVVRQGSPDGLLHWYLDTDGDPTHEIEIAYGLPGDKPVTGDWDGNGTTNIGVVRAGADGLLHWYLDTDGDPDHEIEIAYGLPQDAVVTGDWDGDGKDNIGVVRSGSADGLLHWYLDTDRDPTHEIDIAFGLPGDRPVVGDWNGDGSDDAGVTRTNHDDGLMHWLLDQDRDPTAEIDFAYGLPGDTPVPGSYMFPEITIDGTISGQLVRLADCDLDATGSTQSFVVRNDGSGWLALGAVEVPSGFSLVKGTVSAMPPGASDTLIVQVDSSIPGERSGTLKIFNGDGNESPFSIQLAANVRAADIQIDGVANGGSFLVARTVRGTQIGDAQLTIRNAGSAPATIGNATVTGDFQLVGAPKTVLAAGEVTTATVRMATDRVGAYVGELSFSTNDPADRTYRIRLDGSVAEPLAKARLYYLGADNTWRELGDNQSKPVDFGLHAIGDRAVMTFKMDNAGNIPLVLGQPNAPAGFVVEEGLVTPLAPPQNDTFIVALDTSLPGAKLGSITIDTNDPAIGVFSFPVKGTVGTPDISLSATTLDFGTLTLKSAKSVRELTVKNVGDGPLRFTVDKPPAGYSLAGAGSQITLLPGQSTTLKITLTGSQPGYREGDLVIRTNDGDELVRTVHLNGVAAPFFTVTRVSPPTLIGGVHKLTIRNDTDKPQTFQLVETQPGAVIFQSAIPSALIQPGATATYTYKLKSPKPGTLLRFETSDPTRPTYTIGYGGGLILASFS